MRILVLGADGMLGHELLRQLSQVHEVAGTTRRGSGRYLGVDARRPESVVGVLADFRPDAVVNAVGLVKQRPEGQSHVAALEVNALWPHRLAEMCQVADARLVHVSTDCVFSGERGGYAEDDTPDARDVYGLTKLLGEVTDGKTLTLRTSIIGLELESRRSLVEWFVAQSGEVQGFRRAIYSGVTTMELTRVINLLLESFPELHGLWHVASAPIDKHDLLSRLARHLGRVDVTLTPDDKVSIDRSLRADKLREATGYVAPSWDDMLAELTDRIRDREKTP